MNTFVDLYQTDSRYFEKPYYVLPRWLCEAPSEWGHTAAERGSDNGDLNRQYKEEQGEAPTKGGSND